MTLRISTLARGLATVLFLVASFAAPAALAAPPPTKVPEVMSGSEPRDGVHELQLEEVWRHGGEDDEDVLLGIATAVLSGTEGNIYVLDAQLMEVKVFGADGQILDPLGRQGEGPGEFTNANSMTFLPDGTLGVVQGMPGKIIGLRLDGTPGEVVSIGGDPTAGGFAVVQRADCGGGNLVVGGFEFRMTAEDDQFKRAVTSFLRSYDPSGEMVHEYFTKVEEHTFGEGYVLDEERWDSPARRFAVDHDGRLVVAEGRDDYRFSVYDTGGTRRLVFGREFEGLPRSAAMRERYDRMLSVQARQMSPDGAHAMADDEPDVWNIHCHADGTYWVLNSRGLFEPPEGTFTMWDVFSADGTFERQVTASIPGTPGEDLLFLTADGHAVQVTGFWDAVLSAMGAAGDDSSAEPMEIICYRVL